MSNFVLVHGSWHGAWCWFKIVPRLRALGHHVAAIDRDPGPVIVVAHSRGGVPASQAGERFSERSSPTISTR